MTARPLVGDAANSCIGSNEVLDCRESGPSTLDEVCIVSPEGDTLYMTDGTSAGRLEREGYSSCSDEQWDTLSVAERCK